MMVFNPAHYRELANAVANTDRYDDGELIGPALVEAIITMLTADNPTFDRAAFVTDAGVAVDGAGFT